MDIYAHIKQKKPKFKLHNFFGQPFRIFVIDVPDSLQAVDNLDEDEEEGTSATGWEHVDLCQKQWVYAVIRSVKVIEMNSFGTNYYEEMGPIEVVDLNMIQCVVGRIHDHGHWAIIDHSGQSGFHLTL